MLATPQRLTCGLKFCFAQSVPKADGEPGRNFVISDFLWRMLPCVMSRSSGRLIAAVAFEEFRGFSVGARRER
jgi:hypothetical protein